MRKRSGRGAPVRLSDFGAHCSRAHQRFDELPSPAGEQSFAISHAAYVATFRFALELLHRLDRNPDLQPMLKVVVVSTWFLAV